MAFPHIIKMVDEWCYGDENDVGVCRFNETVRSSGESINEFCVLIVIVISCTNVIRAARRSDAKMRVRRLPR